eukprot:gene12447-13734_t
MSGSPGSCVPKIACIVHYKNIKEESITRLTEKSHSSLLASKSIRERLGGDNWHKEQCEGIPQVFSDDQGYHRSCYAKFTLAKSYAKRRSSDFAEGVRTDSQRSLRSCDPTASSSAVGTILFPKQCMICKKSTPKSVKGKKQPLSLIVTKQAETTLKQAAALHNDQELLVQIQDQDLIAKELLKHRKCYLDYTRIVGKLVEDKELEDAEVPNKTNFSAVCELVQTNILEFQQSISMETLMTVYGGSKERQNRHLLKDRLSKQFPGQLLFVKTDYHEPHIVISASCIETSAFSSVPLLDKEFYINKAAFILRDEVLDFVKSLPELPWPPTVQSMSAENRLGPELLLNFYKKLLAKKGSHHSSSPQERCDITLPEGLRRYCHRDWDQREEIGKVLENEKVKNYIKEYDRCQKKCLEGEFGKTAQFWMQYANAVESLHRLRFAICKNDFDLRLLMWQFWLPFMFMTNKVHYSRYGAYYCFLMEHLDANYPGAREEMEMYGLSVKRNNLGIGQAVDLAGEQTFMKHAKTAGGLKQCLNSETAYEKWVLNRPMQAEYTEGLMDLSGLSRSIMNPRKCLRPSEIIKSEEMVKRVQGIITETFVNPFQADLPKDNLYNIVSGRPVDSKIHSDLCTIRQEGEEVSYAEIPDVKIFILDLAAAVRSTNAKQCTIRQFANRILQAIPHQMEVIYVACDIYSGHSIKEAERKRRGEGERYILNSPDVKVPNDISGFLSNGENKERLFNLIMQMWMEEKYKLGKKVIYFSSKINCHLISKEECKVVEELACNHEEADTKVVFLLDHVLQRYGQHSRVILRSPSGDVDIPIIVYGNQLDTDLRIFLDNGTGKSRKVLDMNSSQLSSVQKRGIIGFHALTGNDYVSSFFGKGKASCYKIYTKFPHLQAAFCNLGNSFTVDEQTKVALREFICKVYGKGRLNDVDEARRELFWNRLRRDNRISDLSVLPPCNRTTEIHIKRANFVALMWKMAKSPMLNLEDPSQHGWTGDLEPDWGTEPYPEDIEQLLVRDNVDAASVDSDDDSDLELEDLDL